MSAGYDFLLDDDAPPAERSQPRSSGYGGGEDRRGSAERRERAEGRIELRRSLGEGVGHHLVRVELRGAGAP